MSSFDAAQPGQGSLHPDELTDSFGKEALNELPDKVWGQAGLHPRSGISLFCRVMDWIMARAMDQHGTTLSGDHFSDADYTDDVAALEYNPTGPQISPSL